jgi:hypothetical protein
MSLAYESAESDIMLVPPRNPKTDRLVTIPLMFYSYFQAGFVETGICYFVFYLVSPLSPSLSLPLCLPLSVFLSPFLIGTFLRRSSPPMASPSLTLPAQRMIISQHLPRVHSLRMLDMSIPPLTRRTSSASPKPPGIS